MEQIEHKLLIVQWVNALLGGLVEPLKVALGRPTHAGADVIPDYVVMSFLVMFGLTALGLIVRTRLSVENPSKFQIILEDLVSAVAGLLDEWIGAKGRQFLPLIGALGAFILVANYIGLVPGFMAPTSNINVTVGCALTSWVYYHLQGVKAQGLIGYLKHFLGPPGVPVLMLPLMLLIEVISHLARVLSLSLRLFGNIFGEELVIAILAFLVPFVVPLPMMALGLITGGLQAFIFVLLSVIYLQGAVVSEHHDEGHGHHEPSSGAHPAPAAA